MDARDWDERYSRSELEWGAEPNRFLVQETDDLEPGRALDLGAGEGRNAIWLGNKGWDVTAIDFSAVGIDKGRRISDGLGIEIRWVVADVLTADVKPASFDLVIVFYVHLPPSERRDLLRLAVAALAPGGVLLIVGHDRKNLTGGVGGPQDPEILLDPLEMVEELASLEITKALRVNRAVEGCERRAIDTLVRGSIPLTR